MSETQKMNIVLHVEYHLFLTNFNETWIFLRLLTDPQIPNFMKICPVGAELFHAYGWTDWRTDLKTSQCAASSRKFHNKLIWENKIWTSNRAILMFLFPFITILWTLNYKAVTLHTDWSKYHFNPNSLCQIIFHVNIFVHEQ